MANGSQPFRRDQEEEAVPFLEGTNHDHPFAAEDVSLQRLHLLARRLAFPFARRIPRVTKRYSRMPGGRSHFVNCSRRFTPFPHAPLSNHTI